MLISTYVCKHLRAGLDVLEFQKQYSEVVRNQASVTLKITKCTTIGPPRIGKTCFKNLLIGQEWDVEAGTASTDVMEAPEWVECYSLEDDGAEELWKLVSKEQQKGELIRAINESTINRTQLTTQPSDVQNPTKPTDMTPPTDAAATPSKVDHQTTPSGTESRNTHDSAHPPTSKSDATRRPATVRQALEALAGGACSSEDLQDILKDKQGKVLGKRRLIHFIDTGGQSIYHDVHPVLITSPSIYLVVFSLKDFKEKNYEGRLSYFRSDLIQRPLRSIYTFGRKTPKVENYLQLHPEAPKIFIVGTHLDQIPPDSQDQFLHELHKMIEGEISSKPYRQFVQYDVKCRSFWAVDTRQAGKEQDEDTKEYISTLRLMVQDRSMEMSVQVPLPWMLLKMVMDGQGVRYCKYSELLKVACNLGYVREDSAEADLDIVLWLFHILGLMYHKVPSECKKEDSLVFIDPGCLYSATSDFLMAAKEEIEDSSEEGQHQTQTASTEETEDNQGDSGEGQHQTQAASTKKTEDNQTGSEEGQPQTQAASTEETEDNQRGSEEGQHQTQASSTDETEDNQGGSEEGQQQTQAASTEETEDNQGGSEEGQHQTQAASTEETEDNQGGSEEGQHQTQASSTEETEDNQRGNEKGQHQTQAASTEETEDNQRGSEEGQNQTQASSTEETEDNQRGNEKGQHQTQAASTEETEDNQRGSEEGQNQTQASSTEETEDNQRGSEESQHQAQASSTEETEDNQRGSEEGQHQTQAASTEETEDNQRGSEEGQHQTQAASTEETEDNQRGSEEGQHQTQAVSTEETEDNQRGSEEGHLHIVELTTEEDPFDMNNYQEAPDLGALTLRRRGSAASQKLKQSSTVQKNLRGGVESLKVSERIRNSMRDFLFDMQRVLHSLAHVVMKVGMEPPDIVLLNLKKIQQGVEENTCSDDANTLQSKYRILAHEIVFKLMKSIRKVLEKSTSEGRKPQLDSIMKDFWFHCGMTRRSIEMDDFNHLLLLLTELRIIAKLDQQDCYLIPAALPRHRDQMFLVARGIEPLLFTLTSQDDLSYYLPSGLFCCLISELVTGLRWTVDPLSRTHVAFRHKSLTGVVHLIESESYIEIQLEPTLQANVDCSSVREQIDERINNVYDMIYDPPESRRAVVASLESRRAVVGFKCNCGRGPAHTPHFAAYEKDEFESCLRCLLQGSTELYVCPLTQQQLVWFPHPAVAGMQ